MTRVLSKHGNVVAVDFRKPEPLTVHIKTEILYLDEAVCLARVSYLLDGKHILPQSHLTANLAAGTVTSTGTRMFIHED